MRRFLIQGFLFFAIILTLAYGFDVLITKALYHSKDPLFLPWNEIFQGRIKADMYIYGSSRARLQIDPKILEEKSPYSVYNFGIDGHNFLMQYARHKAIIAHNPKPKIILFSLDYFVLEKRKDLFNYDQFLPYLSDSIIKTYTQKYTGLDWADYHLPLYRYFGRTWVLKEAKRVLMGQNKEAKGYYQGFQGREEAWDEKLNAVRAQDDSSYFQPIDSMSLRLFHQFIQECQREDIQLIFVYSPEHIEGQKFVTRRAEILARYQSIANQYQIHFLDYSQDTMSTQKQYFFNSQHLNMNGAGVFSLKLAEDLCNLVR